MSIKIEKHWEDLDTFEIEVLDKFGDVFMYKGKPWIMTLASPSSDRIANVMRKNGEEARLWRDRQPASRKNDPLPDTMQERHSYAIIAASHVKWENAPTTQDVDFASDNFKDFLKEEVWYFNQWQKAWTDVKNSARRTDPPSKSSSTGAKSK